MKPKPKHHASTPTLGHIHPSYITALLSEEIGKAEKKEVAEEEIGKGKEERATMASEEEYAEEIGEGKEERGTMASEDLKIIIPLLHPRTKKHLIVATSLAVAINACTIGKKLYNCFVLHKQEFLLYKAAWDLSESLIQMMQSIPEHQRPSDWQGKLDELERTQETWAAEMKKYKWTSRYFKVVEMLKRR